MDHLDQPFTSIPKIFMPTIYQIPKYKMRLIKVPKCYNFQNNFNVLYAVDLLPIPAFKLDDSTWFRGCPGCLILEVEALFDWNKTQPSKR